jgi:tripartite-type tricarboxylate transporter receptor subunit TctC
MKKLLTMLFILISTSAAADTVRLIVPYAQGGGGDQLARVIQKHLSQDINKNVVVEIKPGATTEIGTAIAANSDSKELVLLLNGPTIVVNSLVKEKLTYNPANLVPMIHFGHIPFVLVVSKKSGIKTFKDLENLPPGKVLTYGSSGTASGTHMAMVGLNQQLKKNMLHVPYKGSGQVIPDLISGNIDALMIHWTAVNQFIETDQIIPIAVETDQRLTQLPKVPTFKEFGIANVGKHGYLLMFSNVTIKTNLQNEITLSLSRMINDPDKTSVFRELGYIKEKDPLAVQNFFPTETQRYSRIIKSLNLKE